MTIRKILTEPNKILRQKSVNVESVDKNIQVLMDDMLETLYAAPGIGLAAIQVGIAKRIIVMDINRDKDDKKPKNPMYFINPEIVWKSENLNTYEEGCLSVPNQFAEIEIPEKMNQRGWDRIYNGEKWQIKAGGVADVREARTEHPEYKVATTTETAAVYKEQYPEDAGAVLGTYSKSVTDKILEEGKEDGGKN